MRRLVVTSIAVSLAAGLAGCGKSSTQASDQGSAGQAAPSGEQAQPALTPDEIKKVQASLPAPYNTADLANGEARFAMCASCHSIAPGGPNMTGPHLHGVVGRKAGAVPDYNYSDAVKNAGFTWDGAHLDKWITNPRADLPGTKMSFVGLKDAKDRTDVIAYLMVNSAPKP
ncbi:MAG TPA: cytochrome c family protein [Phenylobacterium sp.]|uniref:cytochrome c family protein n=1 Tax=Phenylobacterium sp. TaxID=1871053 RepID=UPI002B485A9D|nr:cytochrome c family protein [Phenylobacterium sp.]HKR87270.1 cytochrome c family protein [Phenylobacterium sp.]